jgi:putative component of toxin-antitoxin plasmid stabilization module
MRIIKSDSYDRWLKKVKDLFAVMLIQRRIERIETNNYFGDASILGAFQK